MKRNTLSKIFLLDVCVVFIFNYISCKQLSSNELTYTVWTDLSLYTDFQSNFGTTLDDGKYVRLELTNNQWNSIAPNLTNTGKHVWTKKQIKDWFLGRGFGGINTGV